MEAGGEEVVNLTRHFLEPIAILVLALRAHGRRAIARVLIATDGAKPSFDELWLFGCWHDNTLFFCGINSLLSESPFAGIKFLDTNDKILLCELWPCFRIKDPLAVRRLPDEEV